MRRLPAKPGSVEIGEGEAAVLAVVGEEGERRVHVDDFGLEYLLMPGDHRLVPRRVVTTRANLTGLATASGGNLPAPPRSATLRMVETRGIAMPQPRIRFRDLPFAVRPAAMLVFLLAWVLFAELVVDRCGLDEYLPFYRVGVVCP